MKILVATGIYPPTIGGPATYSKMLHDKLPAYGINVEVLSFDEVRHLPKVVSHIAYFLKVIFRSRGCDIVYAQDPVSVGFPAMLAAKVLRKRFMLKIVGDYAWEQGVQRFGVQDLLDEFSLNKSKYGLRIRMFKWMQFIVQKNADKIIVPSKYLKKIVTNWGNVDADKINVVYNAFEGVDFLPAREDLKKELGLKGKVMTSVGRLVPWKGFDGLIVAMQDILKYFPNLTLYIIGNGPDKEHLKNLIAETGLQKSVILLGGLPQKTLFKYIKASDIFVLNTSYEGFSHQLVEVLALGTPCVTTNAGGNVEIIENKKNGILFNYNDVPTIKKSVIRILQDNDLSESLSRAGIETVRNFSEEKMLSETIKQLQSK